MKLDVLCDFIYSFVLGGFIYLIFAVSRLQAKLQDLTDEVDELKKGKEAELSKDDISHPFADDVLMDGD